MADSVGGIDVKVFDKNNVLLEQEIGHGSFGKVFIGTIGNTNLPQVAIKVFFKEIKSRGTVCLADKEKAYEELLKLAVIDHENIVKLYGMVQDEMPWLVFEFMKDGNLLEFVRKSNNIKEKTLLRFCRDICNGMVFLHTNKVLHKDLAARNILLSNKTAKISDLGLSSFLTSDDDGIYALNGKLFPFRHAAKECIVEQVFTFESDVWSFGVLMHEIFTGGSTPYGKENKEADVRRFIVDHITPMDILEPNCSTKVFSLMKSALNPFLEERPTFLFLHSMFDKLLNGRIMQHSSSSLNVYNESLSASSAMTAFHKIKTSGLSSSINNLHLSSPSSSPKNSISQTNDGFLTVTFNNMSTPLSLSSPDIKDKLKQEDIQAKENLPRPRTHSRGRNNNLLQQHTISKAGKLTVKPSFPIPIMQERRHSADHIGQLLLANSNLNSTQLSTSPPMTSTHLDDPDNLRNEARPMSNDHLLEGFVQNRFSKRKP